MADKYPEVKSPKMAELLAKVDAEMDNEVKRYSPLQIRQAPPVIPSEGLLGGMDTTAEGIMSAIAEIKNKLEVLETNAEHGIKRMKGWMSEFATQHAQLLQEMNELQGRINESVERIVDIGNRPSKDNGG